MNSLIGALMILDASAAGVSVPTMRSQIESWPTPGFSSRNLANVSSPLFTLAITESRESVSANRANDMRTESTSFFLPISLANVYPCPLCTSCSTWPTRAVSRYERSIGFCTSRIGVETRFVTNAVLPWSEFTPVESVRSVAMAFAASASYRRMSSAEGWMGTMI